MRVPNWGPRGRPLAFGVLLALGVTLVLAAPGAAAPGGPSSPELPPTAPGLPSTVPVTVPVTQPTAPVTQPPVPVTQPTVPVTQPTVPVTVPTVPVPAPPVLEPGVPLPGVTVPPVPVVGSEPLLRDPGSPPAPEATIGGDALRTGGARAGDVSFPAGAGRTSLAPAAGPRPGVSASGGPTPKSAAALGDRRSLPLRLRTAAAETAQQLSFPIGLALIVVAFLVVQHRMDRGDARMASAGVIRDDDLLGFS